MPADRFASGLAALLVVTVVGAAAAGTTPTLASDAPACVTQAAAAELRIAFQRDDVRQLRALLDTRTCLTLLAGTAYSVMRDDWRTGSLMQIRVYGAQGSVVLWTIRAFVRPGKR